MRISLGNRLLGAMSVVLISALQGCADGAAPSMPSTEPATEPVVFTVSYPLAWLLETLGADAIETHFPAPAGVDPAFWTPNLEAIEAYQQADLVVLNGASYARWLTQVSISNARTLNSSRAFRDQLVYTSKGSVHSHGPEGEHSHGEAAFTVWLDPQLFAQQASAIAARLAALVPTEKPAIEQRLASVRATIHEWHTQLEAISNHLAQTPLIYSHPVYQYLQRRYDLNGVALHWEPDQAPIERQWAELQALLASHPARIMLWEAQPLPAVRARLQQLGIAVVIYRPQGNRPSQGDFASVMHGNIAALQAAVK